MTFTDDDLKRLKDAINSLFTQMEPGDRYLNIERHDVKALLARLEAAEWCASNLDANHDVLEGVNDEDDMALIDDALKAWRKAKGE